MNFAILATDVVAFRLENKQLKVLLVQAKSPRFTDHWALPGGLVKSSEALDTAATRFLNTFLVTGNDSPLHLEQLYSFGDPKRDPSGRVVSVAYLALIPAHLSALSTTGDYPVAAWFPVDKLPGLAYDHRQIIDVALKRLQGKLKYTNLIYSLLPPDFALTQLQQAYETIWGTVLDKRNFRKKILSLKLIKPTARLQPKAAHRPARLYTFVSHSPQVVDLFH